MQELYAGVGGGIKKGCHREANTRARRVASPRVFDRCTRNGDARIFEVRGL